ncbi:hypothetical protein JOD45_003139 [Scopulibacillus daqui]|uniref:Phr family secreted Rap phosphatase inhibitor n=1 Tax=Scopulibacillus daqui TaxID=1469162 RepID=A0ABS2Q3N1_9BACL|nr:hypothetical protein [Scopulibacillus daqui]MBM7646904.1 hypothetical protein [Scopulibacillus daqui]
MRKFLSGLGLLVLGFAISVSVATHGSNELSNHGETLASKQLASSPVITPKNHGETL